MYKNFFRLICIIATVSLFTAPALALTTYSQDFEVLDQGNSDALGNDGWVVYGNVFDAGGMYLFGYGVFPAPNGGTGFSGIEIGQGGLAQGNQQLVVYNDYNCCNPGTVDGIGHFNGTDLVESNVFQEQTIEASDVGTEWLFTFDAKRGNIDGSTTAFAFIKTLDPLDGFALTNFVMLEMTGIPIEWSTFSMSLVIDAGLPGQLLQFGFLSTASNFDGSGIFYDNVDFRPVPLPGALVLMMSAFAGLGLLRRKSAT